MQIIANPMRQDKAIRKLVNKKAEASKTKTKKSKEKKREKKSGEEKPKKMAEEKKTETKKSKEEKAIPHKRLWSKKTPVAGFASKDVGKVKKVLKADAKNVGWAYLTLTYKLFRFLNARDLQNI